jgi:hypothetical protein
VASYEWEDRALEDEHDDDRQVRKKRSAPGKVSLTSLIPVQKKQQPGPRPIAEVASSATAAVPHRARMEQAFGADFGGVNTVLGGGEARASLDANNANAATLGTSIVFSESNPSAELVGHELAHTIQQGGVSAERGAGSVGSTEGEAHALGARAAAGESVRVAGSAQFGIAQFDLRGTVDEQRDARGVDTPSSQGGGQVPTFQNMAEDDPGPVMSHDHGHLDDGNGNVDESLREDPTWSDRLELAKWIIKLEAAELLRPDLVDGTSAYRHFLQGNGATRDIHYGRFIENDSSGQTVLASCTVLTREAAMRRHDEDVGDSPSAGTSSYQIRTDPISVGNDGMFPYPATENWQKAIGAHSIWIEANVTVTVTETPGEGEGAESTFSREFDIEMTIHAEDMYNFNPGAADIATGTPDSANGRFEITGLGHEYLNTGTYTQSFEFEANMDPVGAPGSSSTPTDHGRSSPAGGADNSRGRATER